MVQESSRTALSTVEDVMALAGALTSVGDKLHEALRRLTISQSGDTSLAFALLTEEYALRARINVLQNDAAHHVIADVNFSQGALLSTLRNVEMQLTQAESLERVRSTLSDLITFASSVTPGKAKVVNFLAVELGVKC